MTSLLKALTGIFSASTVETQDQDDRYLADSTDIYDLERRMRQIEAGNRSLFTSGPYGIFMR
jgi:hypothetical protein